ncbi:hypothetical protein KVV02_004325 [Mortierella alpina]|uniref:C2H2-type domain-containing protein n=1 Tax=Mortierella alpina TaxID=64518 RepID=A0A9P8A5U5_MORAP|nr:hypothetical protein KVV02_004325 [Mortierella alpina]
MSTVKPKPKLSYKAQSFPSSDKPFECTACQLYFRRLHDLKRHERLHTGERPYCCKNCRRTFARLDALKRHLSAESNVHCSEWTYEPGLVASQMRSLARSHSRSLSLPHVQDDEVHPNSSQDHSAHIHSAPSPQDNTPFQHRYFGREQLPYSEATMPEYHFTSDRRNSQDMFISRSSPAALAEHQWRQERYSWNAVHPKRSLPMLQTERPAMSSMEIDEDDAPHDRAKIYSPTAHEPLQTSPEPQQSSFSYPQAHSHARSHSNPHPHSHPNLHHSPIKVVHGHSRRESYPSSSSPSRSTPSPSLSPTLSPSVSAMSISTMSSPTNMWSYSKGSDGYDALTTPPRGNTHEGWSHSQSRPEPVSGAHRQYVQDHAPVQEDNSPSKDSRPRELERRLGPSLASILNSHDESPFASADKQSQAQGPQVPHHSCQSSNPHYQAPLPQVHPHAQVHHAHEHEYENEHCCEAMVEIQKLRQELHWVTMQYHTLAKNNECPRPLPST